MKKKKDKKDRFSNIKILSRVLLEAKPIYGWLFIGSLVSLAAVFINLIAPIRLGEISDILYSYWKDGAPMDGIAEKSLTLAFIYMGGAVASLGTMLIMNNVVSRFFTCTIRIKISDKIRRLPVKFVDETPNGEVISRMTEDVSVMGNTLHNFLNTIIQGFLQLIGIAVMMFMINYVLALIVIAIMPLSIILSAIVANKSEKHFATTRTEWGNLYAFLEQDYSGFESVKAFNLENRQIGEHGKIIDKIKTAIGKGQYLSGIVQPIIGLTNNLSYIFIAVLGGYYAISGTISVGDVMAIVLFAKLLASPLENIASGMSMIQRVFASAKRVYELMDKKEMEKNESDIVPEGLGNTEFRNVCFSYNPATPLIENLNVRVKAGQRVAIVGPTGGGKTTIINLIMRFYETDSGDIIIDGVNIKDANPNKLRKLFGMVLQDTWLFSGTVRDNIAYGKQDATDEEVKDAARHACIDRFIESLPKGYDTVINEESNNISGGQKQLLTIARAYLANPKMLILDEATSNVDTRTELLIQETMNRLMEGRTSFIIAHRLSTIVDADIILVVRDGSIVEQGTHEELLNRNGFYTELYKSQYNTALT